MARSYKEKLFAANNLAFSLHQEKVALAKQLQQVEEELQDAKNQMISLAAHCKIGDENYDKLMKVVSRFIEKYEPDFDLFDELRPF